MCIFWFMSTMEFHFKNNSLIVLWQKENLMFLSRYIFICIDLTKFLFCIFEYHLNYLRILKCLNRAQPR